MFAKLAAAAVTILVSLAASVIFFFVLMLGLNGYHGTDGERGLIAFIVWAVVSTFLVGLLSFFGTGYLMNRKQKTPLFAALVLIPAFSALALGLNFAGIIAGIIVAEVSRSSF